MNRSHALGCFLAAVMVAAPAFADNPKVNVDSFRPSVHPGDLLGVQTSNLPNPWRIGAGAFFSYVDKPLRIIDEKGTNLFRSVSYQMMADVVASLGVTRWLGVGLDIPVLLAASGTEPLVGSGFSKAKGGALGDVRLGLKGVFLRPGDEKGFGLALAEDVTFPTSTGRHFFGDDGFTLTTLAVADYLVKGWRVALNAGYRARTKKVDFFPATTLAGGTTGPATFDEIVMGLGAQIPIKCGVWEGIATIESRTKATSPFSSKEVSALDLLAGVKYRWKSLSVLAAGGGGLMKAYGSPNARATLAIAWEPGTNRGCCPDADKDGVCDTDDKCPNEPGPVAQFGCQNDDGDVVFGSEDRCPTLPGTPELHGCPDADKDRVADIDDLCPHVPGLAQFQGCPDKDKDGIQDLKDKCPEEPGPAEFDGCPDTDKDGVQDNEDRCPTVIGLKEYAGCPSPKVEVTKEKIVIHEKVFFQFKKAEILPESNGLLDEVAKTLNAHQELIRIRVEGHTDNVGSKRGNMKLSQGRAETVRAYLIKAGVDPTRMEAQGYGDTKPLTTNTTEGGRAINRRVEFTILQRK